MKRATDGATFVNFGGGKGSEGRNKGMHWIVWLIIILVGLFLLRRLFKSGPSIQVSMQDADYDFLDSVVNGDLGSGYLLQDDDSPLIFTVTPTQTWTDQEVIDIVAALHAHYGTSMSHIADKLHSTSSNVFAAIGAAFLASGGGGGASQAAMDLYFQVLDYWSNMFVNAIGSVTQGVASIVAAQIDGINNAIECVEFELIKDIYETSSEAESVVGTVSLENTYNGGFLGCWENSTTSANYAAIHSLARTDSRHVSFIPLCTNWQLDPTQAAAIMAAGALGIEAQYVILETVINMAPNPHNFIQI
jgi:hypothetical protein